MTMQILLKELSSQKRIIDKLEDTIEALVKRSGRSWSPLIGRQQEIVSVFVDIQASARERRDELLDRLNEVWYWRLRCRISVFQLPFARGWGLGVEPSPDYILLVSSMQETHDLHHNFERTPTAKKFNPAPILQRFTPGTVYLNSITWR